MANTVIAIRSSGTAAATPSLGVLANGELSINYADGIIYYKTSSNTLGSIRTTQPAGLTTEVQYNDAGSFGSNSNFTFNKTIATLNVKNINVSTNLVAANFTATTITTAGGTIAGANIIYSNVFVANSGGYVQFSDGTKQYTANAGSGGGSVAASSITGVMNLTQGGTNAASYTTGAFLTSNGTSFVSVANTGTAGTYGNSAYHPVITTDAYGRVSAVTNTLIQIAASQITSGALPFAQGGTNAASYTTGALLTSNGTSLISLANTGTAGTYGSSSIVPVITTDAYGRVTAVTNTTIDGSALSGVVGARVSVLDDTASTNTYVSAMVLQTGSPSVIYRNTSGFTFNVNTNDSSVGGGLNGTFTAWNANVRSTTKSTSNVTGALRVTGGIGVTGNVYSDGVYDNNTRIITLTQAAFDKANTSPNTANIVNISNTTAATSTNTGALIVAGGLGVTGNIYAGKVFQTIVSNTSTYYLPLVVSDISPQFDGRKTVFTILNDQSPVANIVDSKNVEVVVNGMRLAPYVKQNTWPWITTYDSHKGFRIISSNVSSTVTVYNAPAPGDQAVITIINSSPTPQTRKYPYSAATIALGD